MKQVLVKPVVTEKSTAIQDHLQQYIFVVSKEANKLEIKDAVEAMYGVTVQSVNTTIMPKRAIAKYTKQGLILGKKNSYKKAFVTLVDGDEIDFYANI